MNIAATFVDLAFTLLAIFQGGNSSEALRSTCGALKAISPQSSGWNPLQLNNFLRLAGTPHRHHCSIITLLSWHQSQPHSRPLLSAEWCPESYDDAFVPGYNLELNDEKHIAENHSQNPRTWHYMSFFFLFWCVFVPVKLCTVSCVLCVDQTEISSDNYIELTSVVRPLMELTRLFKTATSVKWMGFTRPQFLLIQIENNTDSYAVRNCRR